jgi:glycosyltransferase involved in cell wall biosynthesis
MRVLILHSRYLSGAVSGENRVVGDEARLLRDAGHEVDLLAPSPDASSVSGRVRAGVSAVWARGAAERVMRLVRERRIDIVHVHNLFPTLSPAVLSSARSAGAAVVMTLHNYRLMCLPATFLRDGHVCESCLGRTPLRGVLYRCYRDSALASGSLAASLAIHRGVRTFSSVTLYLAVSEFVRRKHIEGGMAPDRIRVKDNFTWPAARRDGPGRYFLFLGRLSPEKGVDTLLAAWRRAAPGPLLVVGDGPLAQELRRGAPAGVEFRGAVPASEVPTILAQARGLLVPSRWYEASPRTIVEAYAAGVPVIAGRIGALADAVDDGGTGYLVPPEDAAAWAEASTKLLDVEVSERLGDGALRRWRERHSPEVGLEALEQAYEEALAAR